MTATAPEARPSDTEELPSEITDYVAAVRAHLTDLDPEEVDDLTDDLNSHLAEIRADNDEPFEQIIGTPDQFAAELRQSAGLAQVPAAGQHLASLTRAVERVGHRARRLFAPVIAHRWARATTDFLPELRPAWWVARGYLLAGLLALITGGRLATFLAIPSIAGSTVAGFLVAVAFIVASIRFGRRRHPAPWARWLAVITAVLAAWVAVILFDQLSGSYLSSEGFADPAVAIDGPFIEEPTPANFYAVLPDGTLLDQVLLYDETGAPVSLPESGYSITLDSEFETESAVDETGRSVDNLFPRRLLVPDWSAETGDLEYRVVPPPTIEWGVPITPSEARPPTTAERTTTEQTTTSPSTTSNTAATATTTSPSTTVEPDSDSSAIDPDGS